VGKFEAHTKRQLLRLPNDISTKVIGAVTNTYRERTEEVVSRLADRAQLKATLQPKITSLLKEVGTKDAVKPFNRVFVERTVLDLMMAIS
jgi:hypothetical protein